MFRTLALLFVALAGLAPVLALHARSAMTGRSATASRQSIVAMTKEVSTEAGVKGAFRSGPAAPGAPRAQSLKEIDVLGTQGAILSWWAIPFVAYPAILVRASLNRIASPRPLCSLVCDSGRPHLTRAVRAASN
jgi:hypothetical protein